MDAQPLTLQSTPTYKLAAARLALYAVQALGGAASHVLDLPRQAMESSENYRLGGDYNAAPMTEKAIINSGCSKLMVVNKAEITKTPKPTTKPRTTAAPT